MVKPEQEVGFIQLLRGNRRFTRLWFATALAMMGEWFNTVALYVLTLQLTDSSLALGTIVVLRMAGLAFPQLLTGVLADRFSRKWLMVGSNLLSALVALSLLLVNDPGDMWILYFSVVGLMVLAAVYIPAENAALPNIVSKNELMTANALNSVTWSTTLAFGAALGGWVVAQWGIEVAFITNSLGFLLSALILLTIHIPQERLEKTEERWYLKGFRDVVEGWKEIITRPAVRAIILTKSLWAISGGGLVFLLILMGDEVGFGELAMGVGILFAARGVGTGIGPIIARSLFRDRAAWPAMIGWMVSLCGAGYVLVSLMEWDYWVVLVVIIAHAASGANWVMSTVMLQTLSEDSWRGRMFATDFLIMAGMNGLSTLVASIWYDSGTVSLRQAILTLAILQVIVGIIWVVWISLRGKGIIAAVMAASEAESSDSSGLRSAA